MRTRGLLTAEEAGEVVRQVTNGLPEEIGGTLGNARSLKKIVHRARRFGGERVPKNPELITGWEVPENLQVLQDGSRFLQWDSGMNDPHRILIFATDAMIERMGRTRNYFSDGCFSDMPRQFKQLYSIHGIVVCFTHHYI